VTGGPRHVLRITIEFDPNATPIAGRVEREEMAPQEFEGILELIALVEAARQAAAGSPLARS